MTLTAESVIGTSGMAVVGGCAAAGTDRSRCWYLCIDSWYACAAADILVGLPSAML